MISVAVQVDAKRVSMALGQMATAGKERKTEALASIGKFLLTRTLENIGSHSGPDGAWPRSSLSELYGGERRWNDIARSSNFQVTAAGDGVAVGVSGQAGKAAAVRQLGTVGAGGSLPDIVPVKRKALTIPVSEAASRASYKGTDARTAFPDSFLLTKDGRHGASPLNVGVICRKIGGRMNKGTGKKENQRLEVLYILVKRVAIRPHRFLPVDAAGNLSPASLWDPIDQMLLDATLPAPATGGGAA